MLVRAASSSATTAATEAIETEIVAANGDTTVVRDLHIDSKQRIKRFYRASFNEMNTYADTMNIDYRKDQINDVEFRKVSRVRIQRAELLLRNAQEIERKIAAEYDTFMRNCSMRRMESALSLADAISTAANIERSHRTSYENARKIFLRQRAASGPAFISATGSQVSSNQQMRDIERSAEKKLQQQGSVVKACQAAEAKLLLSLREEPFVVHELLKLWGHRHSKAYNRLLVAYRRLNGLLADYDREREVNIPAPVRIPNIERLLQQVLLPLIE